MPQRYLSRLACMAVPIPAASVVIRLAFSSPTRFFHSLRCVMSLVLLRIVVTLGSFSPSGVRYTRLRVTESFICFNSLYLYLSTNGGGVISVSSVILYIVYSL